LLWPNNPKLSARGEPVPDLNAVALSDPLKAVELLFPRYFVLPIFSNSVSYRIRPLGPESCPKAKTGRRRRNRWCCPVFHLAIQLMSTIALL
jgi:hypothetical protein